MKIIKPSFEFINVGSNNEVLRLIETSGRNCYLSEPKGDPGAFVRKIIDAKHMALLEFSDITMKIVCDRGIMAELTRHRLASFAITSTRYVNYAKDKFGNQITVVLPPWYEDHIPVGEYKFDEYSGCYLMTDFPYTVPFLNDKKECKENAMDWFDAMCCAEEYYNNMIKNGASPQEARSVLPNSLATTIIMKTNLREMKTILNLRCSKAAHPQMRQLMIPILESLYNHFPIIFEQEYTRFRIKQE